MVTYDQQIATLKQELQTNETAFKVGQLAVWLMRNGEIEEAKQILDQKGKMYQNHWLVQFAYGQYYFNWYDYNRARMHFEEALRLDSNNPYVLIGLGRVSQFQNNQKKAIEHISKAYFLNSSLAATQYWMGNVYWWQGDYNNAKKMFAKALESDPSYASAYVGLGHFYLLGGPSFSLSKAKTNFERALAISKNEPGPYIGVANAYEKEGKIKDAMEYYQRAIGISQYNPYRGGAYIGLARIYEREGRLQEAIDVLNASSELHPADTKMQVKQDIERLQLLLKNNSIAE
jgi:tetratricopeptide (TPR) repeat protein